MEKEAVVIELKNNLNHVLSSYEQLRKLTKDHIEKVIIDSDIYTIKMMIKNTQLEKTS